MFSCQAFALDGNSMLSRISRKTLKKLSELGYYKAAFDLKRHPAFTGKFRFFLPISIVILNAINECTLIVVLLNIGISRQWLRSKSVNAKVSRLFEEIDGDSVSSRIISSIKL